MSDEHTCPVCGTDLEQQKGFDAEKGYWTCTVCGQQLFGSDEEEKSATRRFPGVVWHCDGCDAVLNSQDGFDDWHGEWTCTECGRVNRIKQDEIVPGPLGSLLRKFKLVPAKEDTNRLGDGK
jgi:ribosomal protein L37AE/L43A